MSPGGARVAFVGLGRMGLPMCSRLVAAGFDVVGTDLVSERRSEAARRGARAVMTIAEAAREADVLITSLPGPVEVERVIAPVSAALSPEACWIDMSTGTPELAGAIVAAAPRGGRFLDAPVGGGPEEAAHGTLTVYAGGDPDELRRRRPVLDVLAERILHVGPSGSGYAVKLLVNALWFAQAVSTAEVLTLGSRLGLDLDVLHSALNESAAAGRFLAEEVAALRNGDVRPMFALRRCCDELTSVLRLGDELGVPVQTIAAVGAVHEFALERYGDVDGELLGALVVAERAGVELRRR